MYIYIYVKGTLYFWGLCVFRDGHQLLDLEGSRPLPGGSVAPCCLLWCFPAEAVNPVFVCHLVGSLNKHGESVPLRASGTLEFWGMRRRRRLAGLGYLS